MATFCVLTIVIEEYIIVETAYSGRNMYYGVTVQESINKQSVLAIYLGIPLLTTLP